MILQAVCVGGGGGPLFGALIGLVLGFQRDFLWASGVGRPGARDLALVALKLSTIFKEELEPKPDVNHPEPTVL